MKGVHNFKPLLWYSIGMKRSGLKRRSKNPHSVWLRKAKESFNSFIRERDRVLLKGICYTCPSKGDQAGHFIHNSNAVRFDERAVHLQCSKCNLYLNGNLVDYTLRMIEDYGVGEVMAIKTLSHTTKQFGIQELRDLVETYTDKLFTLTSKE